MIVIFLLTLCASLGMWMRHSGLMAPTSSGLCFSPRPYILQELVSLLNFYPVHEHLDIQTEIWGGAAVDLSSSLLSGTLPARFQLPFNLWLPDSGKRGVLFSLESGNCLQAENWGDGGLPWLVFLLLEISLAQPIVPCLKAILSYSLTYFPVCAEGGQCPNAVISRQAWEPVWLPPMSLIELESQSLRACS